MIMTFASTFPVSASSKKKMKNHSIKAKLRARESKTMELRYNRCSTGKPACKVIAGVNY